MMKVSTYFKNLDSLRFMAFFFVFISHLGIDFLFSKQSHLAFLNFLFQLGRVSVSFFFVLSGFLITYLLIKERNTTSSIRLKDFYIKRIFRILPLYFLVCIIGFIIVPLLYGIHVNESAIYHIFLGANFNQIELANIKIEHSMILAPLWSIAVEEQFYLVWPILLFLIKPKYYPYLFISILFGSYVFIYLNKYNYIILILHTISVLPEFMLGAILAYLVYFYSTFIKFIEYLPKWLLVLVYFISFSSILFLPPPYSYIINPFIFSFIIIEQVFAKNSLFKISDIKGLDYLGKISYGLYMYHSIVLYVMMHYSYKLNIFSFNPVLCKIIFVILSLSITIGIAHLSYITIEKYFFRIRDRILNKHRL